jgi:transketolase
MPVGQALDQIAVNTLRMLSVDMIEAANSGHPGLPLGAAPMAYALWRNELRFNPTDPTWFNRDRFILSAGHGSALLYSLLHVFGYELDMDELKNFRQLGSATPGHPEFGETPGVEATTGPLGQGFANGVGMAIAEAWLADRFNVDGLRIIDHYTYGLVSDGDLMEGIAGEAASLAGHLGLGKLIYLYDDNKISLDGPTSLSFSENIPGRFDAMGWHVQTVTDGNDIEGVLAAIKNAQAESGKPSLICVKTIIGYGSPKADTAGVHGAPLGSEAATATRNTLAWAHAEPFTVPTEVEQVAVDAEAKGAALQAQWEAELEKLAESRPDLHAELTAMLESELPEGWDEALENLEFAGKMATRNAGKTALNALAANVPWVIGGAADLSGSTKTIIDGSGAFSRENHGGRNLFFGVREHAMGAVVNGICHHGLLAFGSTFLVFSDYMKGAIRLSCLSDLPALWIFTHDTVFVGEDGPTHQPIEHVMSLRLVPGLDVYRPADAYETAQAFRYAVGNQTPAAIILTRQDLPVLSEYKEQIQEGAGYGAYVLEGEEEEPEIVLVATGSEVSFALGVSRKLQAKGVKARVVSMPCMELFLGQDQDYIDHVLPPDVPRASFEAGVTMGWERIVGDGLTFGIDRYGLSGPGDAVYKELGFDTDAIVEQIEEFLADQES